ncbi:hypothetical protein G6F24_016363 [Rhizopus arrhizus]|nr:hypothetical protein G6F24_016363 [Rhizopus arrhizus]
MEQPDAEPILQATDLMAQRRLADAQLQCGTGEVLVAGGGFEGAQRVQRQGRENPYARPSPIPAVQWCCRCFLAACPCAGAGRRTCVRHIRRERRHCRRRRFRRAGKSQWWPPGRDRAGHR